LSGPVVGKKVRKRRAWYRRRLRIRRTLLTAGMLLLLAAACWQSAARHFGFPTVHSAQLLPESFWARSNVRGDLALIAAQTGSRKAPSGQRRIYPYSVIPGGVRDANDLREIAARDYVVARHFAGFEYRRARLIRARAARAVYMSYRMRNRIFWTHKKVLLHAGDLLLTDGTITARARCGNQISETEQSEVSPDEPSEDVLDQPVAELMPIDRVLPFRSALNRPNLPGAEARPPSAPRLFSGGFSFPYLPYGVPISGLCENPKDTDSKHCHPKPRSPVIPEPATMVLLSSGLVAVFWRYQRAKRNAAAS
jgi:hypothetical protein